MSAVKTLIASLVCLLPAPAWAGWVTVKNDTDQVVLLQEQTTVNGKVIQRKPYRLMPGETMKEFQTKPGERTLAISGIAGVKSTTATVKWDETDIGFAITKGATGYALGTPANTATAKRK